MTHKSGCIPLVSFCLFCVFWWKLGKPSNPFFPAKERQKGSSHQQHFYCLPLIHSHKRLLLAAGYFQLTPPSPGIPTLSFKQNNNMTNPERVLPPLGDVIIIVSLHVQLSWLYLGDLSESPRQVNAPGLEATNRPAIARNCHKPRPLSGTITLLTHSANPSAEILAFRGGLKSDDDFGWAGFFICCFSHLSSRGETEIKDNIIKDLMTRLRGRHTPKIVS